MSEVCVCAIDTPSQHGDEHETRTIGEGPTEATLRPLSMCNRPLGEQFKCASLASSSVSVQANNYYEATTNN
jgi:hypothetical protein